MRYELANAGDVVPLVKAAVDRFGGIDIVVCNAVYSS
jgi:NAD(P)-dependent dehydrogenase (short-subunit alcohol dehydrogenase family)